ncbi:uncharacterized protein VTP21DRAFT_7036 [Calcarisporiella thermophila]|uniref:uncharacterized protein n=1 Tax=Calcarisporiella thermophila TaxID=911321 RepID=UPI0037427200
MTNPSSYRFNHTMLRVKNPQESLDFYTRILGMKLISQHDFPEGKFSLYFLAYRNEPLPESEEERRKLAFSLEGVLELTHNWGTENDAEFKYHSGNAEPKGFGHICVAVDDIASACKRFEELGVRFQKRLDQGSMRNIAFILDPDGYWVELLEVGGPQL